MAHMIPRQIRPETKSYAEKLIYAEMERQLDNDFTVFHSVPWQLRDRRSGARDGEADFVVVHPELGLLVVEVKGGSIRYDGATGQWFSGEHMIDDPFAQARSSAHSLIRLLKEQPYWRNRWVTVGHAVAFPDVRVKETSLRLDAPREIILDQEQVGDIEPWLRSVMRHWSGQDEQFGAPGRNGVAELVRLLSPSLLLKPLMGSEIDLETDEFLRLRDQQFRLLDFLGRQRRVAISGCAGSGKTLLAAEKARRLAAQGFKVLLVCFNRNLADFLRGSLEATPGIHVAHFHGLCLDLARQANLLPGTRGAPQPPNYFTDVLPDLLMQAASRLQYRVDAVIVDEGQDFHENWWIALQCLLNEPDTGTLYIFYDDNQTLYHPEHRIPLAPAPFPLTENCRNTQTIHALVQRFYRGDQPLKPIGPAGRSPDLVRYRTTDELKRELRRQLHHLIIEEGVPADDITILTPRAPERSVLASFGQLGNFRLVADPGGSGEIFYTSVHQFKGLESRIVILTELELDANQDVDTLLYIGASRACNHLIVLAHADIPLPFD